MNVHIKQLIKAMLKRTIKHKCSIIWNKLLNKFQHYSSVFNQKFH